MQTNSFVEVHVFFHKAYQVAVQFAHRLHWRFLGNQRWGGFEVEFQIRGISEFVGDEGR